LLLYTSSARTSGQLVTGRSCAKTGRCVVMQTCECVSCVTCFRFPTIAWRCTKPGCVQLPRPRAQREDKPAPWEPLHTSQVSMRWQRSRYVAMQCYQRSQVNYGFTWRKRSPGQLLADQEGGVQKQNKAQGVLCRLRQGKKLSATNSLRQPLQAESMYVTLSPFSL